MKKPGDRSSDELNERLRERGYRVTDAYVNHRGRLLLVVHGPGLRGFAMFRPEAVALSKGRITANELLVSRRAKPRP